MIKLNLNEIIKVKLTNYGKDIYYHQYDEFAPMIKPSFPKVDSDGFTEMQLWQFINLYGEYINIGMPNVIEDVTIYIKDRCLLEPAHDAGT